MKRNSQIRRTKPLSEEVILKIKTPEDKYYQGAKTHAEQIIKENNFTTNLLKENDKRFKELENENKKSNTKTINRQEEPISKE